MKLNQLRPAHGAKHGRKRVGRGPGSGHGKTSCRGHKGAGQHSAPEFDARFEGGQMPFYRRIPKRGFHSPDRVRYAVVNLGDLNTLGTDKVTVELLQERGIVRRGSPVKVLGRGEPNQGMSVTAHAFSDSARAKLERVGGRAEVCK